MTDVSSLLKQAVADVREAMRETQGRKRAAYAERLRVSGGDVGAIPPPPRKRGQGQTVRVTVSLDSQLAWQIDRAAELATEWLNPETVTEEDQVQVRRSHVVEWLLTSDDHLYAPALLQQRLRRLRYRATDQAKRGRRPPKLPIEPADDSDEEFRYIKGPLK